MRRLVDQQMASWRLSRRIRNRVENTLCMSIVLFSNSFRIWSIGVLSCFVFTRTAYLWHSLSNFCSNMPFQLLPIQK